MWQVFLLLMTRIILPLVHIHKVSLVLLIAHVVGVDYCLLAPKCVVLDRALEEKRLSLKERKRRGGEERPEHKVLRLLHLLQKRKIKKEAEGVEEN